MRFPGFPSAILRDILKSVITEYTLNKRLAMVVKALPVDDLVSLVAGAFLGTVVTQIGFGFNTSSQLSRIFDVCGPFY